MTAPVLVLVGWIEPDEYDADSPMFFPVAHLGTDADVPPDWERVYAYRESPVPPANKNPRAV